MPDVSADADGNSGAYLVYTTCGASGGCYQPSGGTSAAAPLWAAATALFDQYLVSQGKAKTGQINNQLYTLYRNTYGTATYPFHDVTHGDICYLGPTCGTPSGSLMNPPSSPSYTAQAGYNLATVSNVN